MAAEPYNANPVIHSPSKLAARDVLVPRESRFLWSPDHLPSLALPVDDASDDGADTADDIDNIEIFELLRGIYDPEHPLTLEQLSVVNPAHITVTASSPSPTSRVLVEFTPTVPHCGMSTIIGLALRVRLLRALPERLKVDIRVRPGTHQSENALNKQLNDKERVAAALENTALLEVVEKCLSGSAQ